MVTLPEYLPKIKEKICKDTSMVIKIQLEFVIQVRDKGVSVLRKKKKKKNILLTQV